MKQRIKAIALMLIVSFILSASTSHSLADASSYDVAGIYEKVELKDGAKAQDSYGNIKDVKAVYVPTKIDTGKYEVELTKIDSNFYHICGTNLYIETKYCYEYATRDDAILNITSNYGYTRGEVIFLE